MASPPRLRLAHLPTPLEPAPRLSDATPGVEIWLKRDDCTGLALGGNKARKLEYLMASAREQRADTIVTFGGVQSNHTRMTAAAARRLGMGCHLILAGSPPEEIAGNLLLDRLLGATLTFLCLTPAQLTPARVEEAFREAVERLRSEGRRPWRIAPGGSSPEGVLGYRHAHEEILEQSRAAGFTPTRIVTAFGTGGTLAGLVLGSLLAGRPCGILGFSVAPPGMPEALGVPDVASLVVEAAALLGERVAPRPGEVEILYGHAGRAYGAPTDEGIDAIRRVAQAEGVLLEPVYTAKAMAGLLHACGEGRIAAGEKVVFLHTGGTPALFAYGKDLAS